MNQTDPIILLKERILELEMQREIQAKLVKEEFTAVYERMQPINMVKNALREIATSSEVQGLTINSLISLATGFIARKAIVVGSHNPLVKVLGMLVGSGVSEATANYSDEIKNGILNFIRRMLKKRETPSEEPRES